MRPTASATLLLFLALVGCEHRAHDHAHAPPPSGAEPGAATSPAVLPALALDDDAKWPLDDSTRRGLADMKAMVAAADAESVAGRQAAGRALEARLGTLIEDCTMSGPAHDQLHVWLAALIPAIEGLAAEAEPAASRQRLEDVRRLLEQADRHFT